jgi:hypothetical protein
MRARGGAAGDGMANLRGRRDDASDLRPHH